MLYCGFDLFHTSFRTLILSGGFALLASISFHLGEESLNPSLQDWIDSLDKAEG